MLGVMFVMATKPPAWGCATSLVIASVAGLVAAVPIWRRSATHPATPNSPGQAQARRHPLKNCPPSRPLPAGENIRVPFEGLLRQASPRASPRGR